MTALFEAYSPEVEINGQIIENFINGLPDYAKSGIMEILASHEIENVSADVWFKEQNWLNALKEITEKYGENMIYDFAYQMQEQVNYPDHIDNLESALMYLNIYYHEQHQNGEIGNYILTEADSERKRASLECITPYPDSFNRGMITSVAKHFKPEGAIAIFVSESQILPMRSNGDDRTTFVITWKTSATDLFS